MDSFHVISSRLRNEIVFVACLFAMLEGFVLIGSVRLFALLRGRCTTHPHEHVRIRTLIFRSLFRYSSPCSRVSHIDAEEERRGRTNRERKKKTYTLPPLLLGKWYKHVIIGMARPPVLQRVTSRHSLLDESYPILCTIESSYIADGHGVGNAPVCSSTCVETEREWMFRNTRFESRVSSMIHQRHGR